MASNDIEQLQKHVSALASQIAELNGAVLDLHDRLTSIDRAVVELQDGFFGGSRV
jgi:prefoldin subunit 5